MNKALVLFLILISVSFCENSFGSSRIDIERTWMITCPAESCSIEFDGLLAVNNSNQKIISMETEPRMEILENDSEIHVIYAGDISEGTTILNANITVEVDYDTKIRKDRSLSGQETISTRLTEYNDDIAETAAVLAENDSMLKTIRNNVEWVHENVEYDLAYFGVSNDAQTVFRERRGVCSEYAHLLISMLNSLGIETRYVNGYVLAEEWQPHAWVEAYIPGYGWLPMDPTFNQVGIIDSSHAMISYGADQESIYDIVTSKKSDIMLSSETHIADYSPAEDEKGIRLSLDFDDETNIVEAKIVNTRNEYIFGSYTFSSPEKYWGRESELLLLEPLETRTEQYQLDYESLSAGYVYTIPVEASVNDAEISEQISIRKEADGEEQLEGDLCLSAFILGLLPVVLWSRET